MMPHDAALVDFDWRLRISRGDKTTQRGAVISLHHHSDPSEPEGYMDALVESAAKPKINGASEKSRTFPAVWLADAAPQTEPEILKGLMSAGTLVVVYGASGSGKSFFVGDLAMHIACNLSWRGRRVRQSLVAYIAAEAGNSIQKRFAPARDHLVGDAHEGPLPFAILTRGPNLLDALDVDALVSQLHVLAEQAGIPLGVVVFDTLSRSIPGGDENRTEDMTRVIETADCIRDTFGATTIVVHHTGKDLSKGARGNNSLTAAADLVLSVAEKVATVEKVRDGVAGEQFAFRLEVIELGTDADGDPITTCLVHPLDAAPQASGRRQKLTHGAQVALDALRTAISENGETLPATSVLPGGVRGVKADTWQDVYCRTRPISPTLPKDEAKRERNARRMAFRRAQDELQAGRVAGTEAGFWWLSTRT
jgi:hypothetical protein